MNYNNFKKYLEQELIEYQQGELALKEQLFTTYPAFKNYQEEPAQEELAQTLSKLVDSLAASETAQADYHQLPAAIFTEQDYFQNHQPSLGKKTQSVEIISEEHYQVLDTITGFFLTKWAVNAKLVTEGQTKVKLYQELLTDPANPNRAFTISQIEQWISDYDALTYLTREALATELATCQSMLANYTEPDNTTPSLETKFLTITEQVQACLASKLTTDAQLLEEVSKVFGAEVVTATQETELDLFSVLATKEQVELEPLFRILLTYPEIEPILSSIRQWRLAYQRATLTAEEEQQLAPLAQALNTITDLVDELEHQEEEEEATIEEVEEKEETDSTIPTTKDDSTKQRHLIYFGGVIIVILLLAILFERRK